MKINTKPFEEILVSLEDSKDEILQILTRDSVAQFKFQTMADLIQEMIKLAEAVNAMMPQEVSEIKNCPFCGSSPIIEKNSSFDDEWIAHCPNEDCVLNLNSIFESKSKAYEKWNTRK